MPGFGTWSKSIIFMVKTFAVYASNLKTGHDVGSNSLSNGIFIIVSVLI